MRSLPQPTRAWPRRGRHRRNTSSSTTTSLHQALGYRAPRQVFVQALDLNQFRAGEKKKTLARALHYQHNEMQTWARISYLTIGPIAVSKIGSNLTAMKPIEGGTAMTASDKIVANNKITCRRCCCCRAAVVGALWNPCHFWQLRRAVGIVVATMKLGPYVVMSLRNIDR